MRETVALFPNPRLITHTTAFCAVNSAEIKLNGTCLRVLVLFRMCLERLWWGEACAVKNMSF